MTGASEEEAIFGGGSGGGWLSLDEGYIRAGTLPTFTFSKSAALKAANELERPST